MEPGKADDEKLLKVISKIHTIESQEKLISLVKDNTQLLQSKILSSIQPKIGKEFSYIDLENNKKTLLIKVRKQLLELAAEERRRDLKNVENDLHHFNLNRNDDEINRMNNKIKTRTTTIINRINQKMNNKIKFHSNINEEINFTNDRPSKRKKRKLKTKETKRRNRQKYKANQKIKRRNRLKARIQEIIKNNIVINLSNFDIPDHVYLYLAKGLNFVPSCKTNTHSLKFDAQNFIRKLEWKAFFAQHPELRNNDNNNIQRDLIVESNKHPDFQHTCINKVKTKLFGWIANHQFKTPKSNLTPAEREGKSGLWKRSKIRSYLYQKLIKVVPR